MTSQHLIQQMRHQFLSRGEATALKFKRGEQWQDTDWNQLQQEIDQLAQGLLSLGVDTQEKVGILSGNRPQWVSADLAIMSVRGVTVPIYPTSTLEQIRYILKDAGIRHLFVSGAEQCANACTLADEGELDSVILLSEGCMEDFHPAVITLDELKARGFEDKYSALWQARFDSLASDDLFTLIYTSGTTGEPKGVMLDYDNMRASFEMHDDFIDVGKGDLSLGFLPLSHVFERAWSLYQLRQGATVAYIEDPREVQAALAEVKPTLFAAVPRLFEKIYATIYHKLESAPSHKRAMFQWAINVGKQVQAHKRAGTQAPALLKVQHGIAEKLIFNKIRQLLGGRIRFMPCGGAKLDSQVVEFFHAIGLDVICGYGMTETVATITAFGSDGQDLNSCGKPLSGIEVRLSDDNEILVKGATVMRGYYNKPEATAETMCDGWLRTGDAGRFTETGELVITERLKELMKTSNGKYIAPQVVEGAIGQDHYIEQVAVIADGRHFVTALLVPSFEALEAFAHEQGIKFRERLDLLAHPDIKKLLDQRIKECQRSLAKFEQVKKYRLLAREFSMEEGEITPTLKLRRRVINMRYRAEIEAMYAS